MDLERIKDIVKRTNQEQLDTVERISELANTLVELRKLEAETIDQLRMLTNNLTFKNVPEDKMIETLGLTTKTFNRLVGNHGRNREDSPFQTIRDILDVPKYKWHEIIGRGSKATAREIEDRMHEAGFIDFEISLDRGYKAGSAN